MQSKNKINYLNQSIKSIFGQLLTESPGLKGFLLASWSIPPPIANPRIKLLFSTSFTISIHS